jgi:hypothetical protein
MRSPIRGFLTGFRVHVRNRGYFTGVRVQIPPRPHGYAHFPRFDNRLNTRRCGFPLRGERWAGGDLLRFTADALTLAYQRLLSATAHSALHGLARMLTPLSPNEGRPGEALAAVRPVLARGWHGPPTHICRLLCHSVP